MYLFRCKLPSENQSRCYLIVVEGFNTQLSHKNALLETHGRSHEEQFSSFMHYY